MIDMDVCSSYVFVVYRVPDDRLYGQLQFRCSPSLVALFDCAVCGVVDADVCRGKLEIY